MGRRAWVLTALLVVVAVACAAVAVVAAQQRSDAQQQKDDAEAQSTDAATELDALRTQAAGQQATLTDLDTRAQQLQSMFTPDVLTAIGQVQAEAIAGACTTARTATRDGTDLPAGDVAASYAAATAPAAHDNLDGLPPRWSRMIDPTALQAEIDRCAADEQAIMDAEAAAEQRFCGVPLFPEDYCPTQAEIDAENNYEGLVDDCAGGDQAACDAAGISFEPPEPHFGAIGPLVDACYAGDQAACSDLRAMGVPGF